MGKVKEMLLAKTEGQNPYIEAKEGEKQPEKRVVVKVAKDNLKDYLRTIKGFEYFVFNDGQSDYVEVEVIL